LRVMARRWRGVEVDDEVPYGPRAEVALSKESS
jgi:hypothetical protein